MEVIDVPQLKGRSRAEKIGKHKYEIQLLHRVEARQKRIEDMMHIIFQGLSDYFHFDRPLIEKVACESEVDLAVVSTVFEAGSGGVLAKEIIKTLLNQYPGLNDVHKVQRIINRVNRNTGEAFGRGIIEKQGKKWVFTSFGVEIWGKTEEDQDEPVVDEDKDGSQDSD